MESAFGVEHGWFSKAGSPKKDEHPGSGAAIAGAGGVTAAGGALGGGIPGIKSNSKKIAAWGASGSGKGGKVRQAASTARAKAPAAHAAAGGVFGYRTQAHKTFADEAKINEAHHAGTTTSRANMFWRGHHSGKIPIEGEIIRHMRIGRAGATAALVGGGAAGVYGVKRMGEERKKKLVSKAQKDTDKLHGALLGAGATTAAGSYGGARFMERQGRKWSARSARNISGAQKIVPNMGGYTVEHSHPKTKLNPRVPDIKPEKTESAIANNKKILAGKSKIQAEAAGKLRGEAGQARYFSHVYGKTALQARRLVKPSLAVAGVGAAGLALSRRKDKS